MFRSIQRKLVVVYLLLILVAMELTGIYLLQSLRAYYYNSFRLNLIGQAQLLSALSQRYLASSAGAGASDQAGLARLVSEWSPETGVSVVILDNTGEVLGASRLQGQLVGNRLITDEITHALGGSTGENLAADPETGAPTLFLAVPVRSGNQIVGVVYLKGSLESTNAILADIRSALLTATVIALGVTAILGAALARTITGPIREVTQKAARLARGDFDQAIPERSTDEVGQLASMFNHMAGRLKQTLMDISEERNRLEAILAYMADGLVALDRAGRVMRVNRAAARMLELDMEGAPGVPIGGLLPGLGLDTALTEAVATGHTVARELTRSTAGGLQTLQCFITPLRADRSPATGAVMVFHDITELQKLESMRREFVANVSHELKTPLTTVKSYVETLLDGASADPALLARFLRVVETETDRMVRLVRDLLHLSQMDAGTLQWEIEPVDVTLVAEEAVAKLAVPAQRKQLLVRRHWAPDLPLALIDRDKALQVFLNVLANAIDFTPEGGSIDVYAEPRSGAVRVRVRDTGVGIPQADLSRIFERFYRVDKARSRTLGGTGLGLAIARQIVEALGGTISITSDVGAGTEVSLTVPAAPGPVGELAPSGGVGV